MKKTVHLLAVVSAVLIPSIIYAQSRDATALMMEMANPSGTNSGGALNLPAPLPPIYPPEDPATLTSGTLSTNVGVNWSTAPWNITTGDAGFPDQGGTATFNEQVNNNNTIPAVPIIALNVTPTLSGLIFNSVFQYQIGASSATSFALTSTGTNTLDVQVSNFSTPTAFAAGDVIAAQITGGGAFGLTKTGAGIITIAASNNSYTGGTFINGGTLRITVGDGGLGAIGAGNGVTINDGGILRVSTTALTSARTFSLSGNTAIELFANATLNGIVSGSGTLTHLVGSTLTLSAANTFTGTFAQTAGTLTVNGAAGTTSTATGYDITGTLSLDNSGTNNNDRISDTAAITSRGAVLTLNGNATAATPTSEVAGALNLFSGNTAVTVTPNAANPASLTFASINRMNNSTLFVRGTNLGATPANGVAQIISTASPGALIGGGGAPGSTNISILPWAVGNTIAANTLGSSLVTRDSGTGQLRPLATAEYAAAFGSATDNVRLTASTAAGVGDTANAVLFAPAGAATLSGGPINITSGAFLYSPTATATGTVSAGLSFGAAEGFIHTSNTLGVSGVIDGTGGLTINPFNGSTVTLSGANTYTGTTTLNGGTTAFSGTVANGGAGVFGASTSAIVMNVGSATTRLYGNAAGVVLNRDLIVTGNPSLSVSAGLGTVGVTDFTMNGNIDLQRRLSLDGGGTVATPMIMNGIISGVGSLTDQFANFAVLNGNNTYSGGTEIQTGTYMAGTDTAFGTGTIFMTGLGFIQSKDATAHTLANNLLLLNTTTFSGTGALTFNGTVNLDGPRTISVTDTAAAGVTLNGVVSGGSLTKTGTGLLVLNSASGNTYTGGTVVSGGTLNANTVGALGVGTLNLSGATSIANINANQTVAGLAAAASGPTVNIASGVNLTLNTPGSFTYSGILAGLGSLTKTGAGQQTLQTSTTNSYSGGTFVNAGTLTFNQDNSLGTGLVTLGTAAGGDATLITTTNNNPANNILVASTAAPAAGTLTLGSSSTAATGGTYSGLITLNQNVNLTSQNTGATTGLKFTGNITGPGGINKVQVGVAVFNPTSGVNDYAGGTTISAGQLTVRKDSALGTGNVSLLASGVTLLLQDGVTNNYISDSASISIVTGAVANLNFTLGQTDVVGGIVLNGAVQTTPGTYGSSTSNADFQSTFFLGNGTLTLIPEPSTWVMTIVGASLLLGAQRFRRKNNR